MARKEPETLLDLLVIFPARKMLSFIGRTAVVAGVIGAATHVIGGMFHAGQAVAPSSPAPGPSNAPTVDISVPATAQAPAQFVEMKPLQAEHVASVKGPDFRL